MKDILTVLVAGPILALFVGIGLLAMRIGDTWTPQMTNQVVTGFTMACGAGAVVLALILALIIGIPMAIRYMEAHNRAGGRPRDLGPVIDADWHPVPGPTQPPALPGPTQAPPWGLTGGGQVDLLEDTDRRFKYKG